MRVIAYLTAFVGGFITMSLEIVGFRALAPHFGYSTYVFGTLIGLILFAMAAGYWLGGLLSRKGIRPHAFFLILLAASAYLLGASIFYENIISSLANLNIVAGAFSVTFILWAIPMASLASISPYLVGLEASKEQAGYSSGKISAAGTLGGLAGTFATSFYLLPFFGTHATFLGNAYASMLMSLLWLLVHNKRWLVVMISLPLLARFTDPSPITSPGVVHAEESAYSRLEVVDQGKVLILRTDRRSGTGYSGINKDGSIPPFLIYNLFAVPAAAKDSKSALMLGIGAGTLIRIHNELNPNLQIKGVEIDPQVIDVGNKFFGLGELKNLKSVVISDARPFLAKDRGSYDIVEMDVFHEAEIPFYLVSKEFFQLSQDRLSEKGILMMNIHDPSGDRRIQKRIANTIASVYPYTYEVSAGLGSYLMVAAEAPIEIPAALEGSSNGRLASLAGYMREHIQPVSFDPKLQTFTDDRAPIETLYVAPAPEISYNKNL